MTSKRAEQMAFTFGADSSRECLKKSHHHPSAWSWQQLSQKLLKLTAWAMRGGKNLTLFGARVNTTWKKVVFSLFPFPLHLPEHWCSETRKRFSVCWATFCQGFSLYEMTRCAVVGRGPGEKSFLLSFFMQGYDQICTYVCCING